MPGEGFFNTIVVWRTFAWLRSVTVEMYARVLGLWLASLNVRLRLFFFRSESLVHLDTAIVACCKHDAYNIYINQWQDNLLCLFR
jgi:hypothetical protein